MGGSSSSQQQGGLQVQQMPNALGNTGYQTSSNLFSQAAGQQGQQNPFLPQLYNTLTNPDFSNQPGTVGANLIQSIMDQTSGNTAVRGLGAPTQTALGAAIAPTMEQLYQGQVSGLTGGSSAYTADQSQNMTALLNLIGLAMPQTIAGEQTSGSSGGWQFL